CADEVLRAGEDEGRQMAHIEDGALARRGGEDLLVAGKVIVRARRPVESSLDGSRAEISGEPHLAREERLIEGDRKRLGRARVADEVGKAKTDDERLAVDVEGLLVLDSVNAAPAVDRHLDREDAVATGRGDLAIGTDDDLVEERRSHAPRAAGDLEPSGREAKRREELVLLLERSKLLKDAAGLGAVGNHEG